MYRTLAKIGFDRSLRFLLYFRRNHSLYLTQQKQRNKIGNWKREIGKCRTTGVSIIRWPMPWPKKRRGPSSGPIIYVKCKKWTIFASFTTDVPPECYKIRVQTQTQNVSVDFLYPTFKVASPPMIATVSWVPSTLNSNYYPIKFWPSHSLDIRAWSSPPFWFLNAPSGP